MYRIPEVGGAFVPQTFRSSSSRFGLPLLLASSFEKSFPNIAMITSIFGLHSIYIQSKARPIMRRPNIDYLLYAAIASGLRHSSEVSKAPSYSPLI